jgi:signal transduction histidine kinase
MRPSQWLVGRAPRPSRATSDSVGPAIVALRVGATRTVAIIRCAGIVCTAAQVVIWHSFYGAVPWRLAGPILTMAWGMMAVGYLWRHWPSVPLAITDSMIYIALALCARWYVPPVLSGDTFNWLYLSIIGQIVTPAWFTPSWALALLALGTGAAYWAGAVLSPQSGAAVTRPTIGSVMIVVVAVAAWAGRRLLYRRAMAADAALTLADQDYREQYILLTRLTERREHERMLHDTVLNTLTALARLDSGSGALMRHCEDDIALMERMLGDPDEDDLAGRGLGHAITAVAAELRTRGLIVHVQGVLAPDAEPVLPPQAVRATRYAVREALMNVMNHAGTGEAWVEVSLAAGGELRVIVRDAGIGFDRGLVSPARLGVRHSIIERVTDQGGHASIQSAPGRGTTVELRWETSSRAARAIAGGSPEPPSVASQDRLVHGAYESELPRVLGVVAALWQLAFLLQVLGYLHEYREPLVPLLVWAALTAAACWLIPQTRTGDLTGRAAACALALVVVAVSLDGWAGRMPGSAGTVDWSIFGSSWLIALVAVSRPAWEWAGGALLAFAAHLAFSANLLGTPTLGLSKLTASAHALAVIGIIFAAIRPTLRAQARIAVRRAALASQSAAEAAAVAAIREDRRVRLALLDAEALPLLHAIAAGTLEPADSAVRDRCARLATTFRRSLTNGSRGAEQGLVAELAPALRAASDRGLLVDVQTIGDHGTPGPEVSAAALAAIAGVLGTLPPQPVTLTLLASADDDVALYLAFSRPPGRAPDMARAGQSVPPSAQWRASIDMDDSGAGCLEVSWRALKAMPAK